MGWLRKKTGVELSLRNSQFAKCEVNSYYCDGNVSHSMKNAKQIIRFKINLIKRCEEWMASLL